MKSNFGTDNEQNQDYNKRKWNYIIRNVILSRILPLLIILITINELFYKTYEKNHNAFFILLILKACLGITIGFFAGIYEWNFNEKLVRGYFKEIREIKKEYVRIFGIIGWGLIIGVCYFQYPIKSLFSVLIDIVIWLITGYILGLFTWNKVRVKYEKYVHK